MLNICSPPKILIHKKYPSQGWRGQIVFVCVWVNACLYTLRVSVYAHSSNTAREGMTHTSKQAIFGLCQQLPPLFLNPGNANISSNLKVPWNSLPSSLQRGQKPFCCWGCMGCWLVRRQDGVLVALVAVVWQCRQPVARPRRTGSLRSELALPSSTANLLSLSGSALSSTT